MTTALALASLDVLEAPALAASTGLAPSTARTILSSLVMHGLIAQSGSGSSYTLGSRFFELNRRFAMQADLSAVAAPVLRALWERTNETVHLAVLQGNRRVDLAVLVSPQLLRVDPTSTGYLDASASPLYKTAAGKVLFAGLSPTDRQEAAGVCGVAAPVHGQAGGTIAALCLGHPSIRHTPEHGRLLHDEVMEAAADLSLLLGAEAKEATR